MRYLEIIMAAGGANTGGFWFANWNLSYCFDVLLAGERQGFSGNEKLSPKVTDVV